jgi:ribonuclease HI
MVNYKLYFDGSCGPKSGGGTAAYGFALFREGQQEPVEQGSGVIGTGEGMTNNLAEFYALDKGLSAFIRRHDTTARHTLSVYGDSNLVIQIMNRHWKARSDKPYYPYYELALANAGIIRKAGHRVTFDWIPRALNQVCDDLSKVHQKKVCQNDKITVDKFSEVC